MNIIVAVPLERELAESIGKKGSENGITFYNRKVGDDVIVAIAPTSLEDKFYALSEVMMLADKIVISTKRVDSAFGEALVAASLVGKKTILTDDNDVQAILKGVNMPGVSVCSRDALLGEISAGGSLNQTSGELRVDIDKCFNVKGVGTVALGIVRRGMVKVHDSLLTSDGRQVSVRSIQSQDADVHEAGPGTRVGLALKGIDESDMGKGEVLAPKQIRRAKSITLEVRQSPVSKEAMTVGKSYGIASGFSHVNCILEGIDGNVARFRPDKAVPLEVGEAVLVSRKEVPRIFASGTVKQVEG